MREVCLLYLSVAQDDSAAVLPLEELIRVPAEDPGGTEALVLLVVVLFNDDQAVLLGQGWILGTAARGRGVGRRILSRGI